MKKIILIIGLFLAFLDCKSQDNVILNGVYYDSICIYPNTVWVKKASGELICDEYYPTVEWNGKLCMNKNLHCTDGGSGIYSYDNDPTISAEYGYLYTYAAAIRIDALIEGWHIITIADIIYESGNLPEGWNHQFAGNRTSGGTYQYIDMVAHYWNEEINATNANGMRTMTPLSYLRFQNNKTNAVSVRLIKD
jgi:hypothetical protein